MPDMNDIEFDIIDELYFVTAFSELNRELGLPEEELGRHLQDLVVRGYVKCFYPDPDTEVSYQEAAFAGQYRAYYYLATKAGLVAHNSR
jgi:DNA-binding Lrp family transcriptional regulator